MKTTLTTKLILDTKTQERLVKILRRDTKVIRRVLGILNFEEKQIYEKIPSKYTDRFYFRTNRNRLSRFMIRTKYRKNVPYDLKSEFSRISHNELSECIDVANDMYKSYLSLRQKYKTHVPRIPKGRLVPRFISPRRAKLDFENNIIDLMDSYDTNVAIWQGKQSRILHDRLYLKFSMYSRLKKYFDKHKYKMVRLFSKNGEFEAHFTFEIDNTEKEIKSELEFGMLGIDLGINKDLTTALITKNGLIESKIFNNKQLKTRLVKITDEIATQQRRISLISKRRYQGILNHYKKRVKDNQSRTLIRAILNRLKHDKSPKYVIEALIPLLREKIKAERLLTSHLQDLLTNWGRFNQYSSILGNIKRLRQKRRNLKQERINQLCSKLADYIKELSSSCNIFVTIGSVRGIRYSAKRGNGNKSLRRKIHNWSYKKVSYQIYHNLRKIDLSKRIRTVQEFYTSIRCWKCSKTGTRPKQEEFFCSNYECDLKKINADINGAANIAIRGIKYRSNEDLNKILEHLERESTNIDLKYEKIVAN